MIKPSRRLSKEFRELVIGAFENAVEQIGEEEFFYMENRIERKLQAVRASQDFLGTRSRHLLRGAI